MSRSLLGRTDIYPRGTRSNVDDDGNPINSQLVTTRKDNATVANTKASNRIPKSHSRHNAIVWAREQLPFMSESELQAQFDAHEPDANGKKAPVLVERVNQLVLEQF